MEDSWASGDSYDFFMGRWSRLVARSFIDWLSPPTGIRWLDVGCGSGALSEVVIKNYKPAEITAIDQSESFVTMAQKNLGSQARCRVGSALALPLVDSSIDITVSGLVMNFIPDPEKALAEMRRVTVPGGIVALYVWDYAGKMDFLRHFWDAAVELNPDAFKLHEGTRFPDTNADGLESLFVRSGFVETITAPIDIVTQFIDFDDYWNPFLGKQGPAPTYVASLNAEDRNNLRDTLYERLSIQSDGSISMAARAWAVSGQL